MQGFKTYKTPVGGGGGGGGYNGVQVTGMTEGFFWGLQFSIPGFFQEGLFGKYFHWLACFK